MFKKIFSSAVLSIIISTSFANALDDLLPKSDDFTNLSGISKCIFDEHKPGSPPSKRDLQYLYFISLPKSWSVTKSECDPRKLGKNDVPRVRFVFPTFRPAVPFHAIENSGHCNLQTGNEKTVYTAIHCHSIMRPGKTLVQEYNEAYAEVGRLNCWSNPITRHVSSTEECSEIKKRFDKAYERSTPAEDPYNGSRFACLKTTDSFDKFKTDKKLGCKLIQDTCKSYDPEFFKDFCKAVETAPVNPDSPEGQCKAKDGYIWAPYLDGNYQCEKCSEPKVPNAEKSACVQPVTENKCKDTANARWDDATKKCMCVNGREPVADALGRVSCDLRNPPDIAKTCEQTYSTDMISDGQGQCKCKTEGNIWNEQEKKCKPPAGWTPTPPPDGKPKPGDSCVTSDTRQQGVVAQDGVTCSPITQCFNCTDPNKHCVEGRCVPKSQTCPQGQVLQNTQCVPQQQQCQQGQVLQNGQCVPQQQQCKQDEEMIQGRCFPKKPNPQQQKEQPKQQQQQGPTPQQQQQMQQLQAMQECQMRQPQGAWQWNGFQCLPNPNYNPQGYGAQPSVGGGVVCNFFGSDAIEVPAGEQFSVTYDVTGAKREIKVDTSPKSTTKYDRQAPTTQANTNTVLNQFGYPQNGTGAAVQTSQQGQATITAPKKKGKLKVSLIVDAVRQNSEACKPIQVTIVDAVQQQSSYDSGSTSNYDSGSQYASNTQPQDTGPTIETPSEIIAQNRKVVSSQPAQQAPEDDDAYAYLCKTLGIGCAKDAPQVDSGPSIRDLQQGNSTQQQGTTREITIDPNAEDPADLPNIGELPGEGGENTRNGQQLATDVGIDGDNKKAYSTVLNYLGENGQYAEPIGPNSDTSGVLNSTDAEAPAQTGDRVGIFTRMWRWFLNLLGFGPEYVAA